MPKNSVNIDAGSVRTQTTGSINIEKGILTAASVINISETAELMTTFARITLGSLTTEKKDALIILASGWVDAMTGISWTGKLSMESDYIIYADIWSSAGNNVKLSITVDQ